jgi:hypothetical protein
MDRELALAEQMRADARHHVRAKASDASTPSRPLGSWLRKYANDAERRAAAREREKHRRVTDPVWAEQDRAKRRARRARARAACKAAAARGPVPPRKRERMGGPGNRESEALQRDRSAVT